MAHFRSRYPGIKVMFSSGFLSDCLPKLLTDKLDLSLVMTGRHQKDVLTALIEDPLFEVDQGVVTDASHPLFDPANDTTEILASSEWLSTTQDEKFLLAQLESLGIPAPKTLTLCDFYGIDVLNGRNQALSLSPLSVVEEERYRGRLKALDPQKFPLPALTVSFFYRKGVELTPQADYMRPCLREAFSTWYQEKPHRFVRLIDGGNS